MPYPNPPSTGKNKRGRFQAPLQRLLPDIANSRALISEISNKLMDDVIASRRSGGHILGTGRGGDGTTRAIDQTGQENQSALHSRYHMKRTYASLFP
jgi:hypothetical protein